MYDGIIMVTEYTLLSSAEPKVLPYDILQYLNRVHRRRYIRVFVRRSGGYQFFWAKRFLNDAGYSTQEETQNTCGITFVGVSSQTRFFFVYLNPRHCPHGLRLSEQQTVRFSKVKSRFLFLQERASQARTLGKIKRGTHLYRIKKASDGHVLPLSYHVLGYTLVTNFWLFSFPNGRASKSLPILVKFE